MSLSHQEPLTFHDLSSDNAKFFLALTIFGEKVRSLHPDDQQSLFELLPSLFGDDPEEQQSSWETVREIVDHKPGKLVRMQMADSFPAELQGWVDRISVRLKEARKKAGLTQEQLSEKSGLPQSHISRLEAGQHSPNAKTLQKLAEALGIPVTDFDPTLT